VHVADGEAEAVRDVLAAAGARDIEVAVWNE
jgi:hypothetical protein